MLLLLSPMLLFLLRAALLVSMRGFDVGGAHSEDPRGFTFPGGSGGAGLDPIDLCMLVSPPCTSEADRYSLEALRNIHQMMDDDHDGGIEVEESVEFIIEDMKEQQTNKHNNLHREDAHITVEELWRGWKSSEVHNWTQDAVLRWLKGFVELPQYERNFLDFKVNGNTLPRIAANEPAFLSGHLRIQDQRDKQKLNIKALDVVLFGPPTRPPHNYMKDMLLLVSVVMGVGGCWFAQVQNKVSKIHISKMMKDLESLQHAELSLHELQEQLERAQEEKRNAAEEKHHLEEKMRGEVLGAQQEAHRLLRLRQGAATELSRLRYAEEELEQVRGALKQAEKDMQVSCSASEGLQLWLQLTHEVEVQYYNVKKQSAELQLASAKEEAEKIKKKRSSVLGTLHVAHSSSLDQVDHKILEAKNALSDVTACLRERLHRWQQVERLCGFPIFRNAGLAQLTAVLYSDPGPGARGPAQHPCQGSLQGSLEDLLDDSPASGLPQMPGGSLKRSPCMRSSVVCRSRRPGVIVPPQAAMISPDPDLLLPMRAPVPRSEEDEGRFLNPKRPPHVKQSSFELYLDPDYMSPVSRAFPTSSSSSSDSPRKLYRDEAVEPSASEPRASVEPPVHRTSLEEVEASVELAQRAVRDAPMETHGLHRPEEAALSPVEGGFRRNPNPYPTGRTEDSLESYGRKAPANEPGAGVDFATRKSDLADSASRNVHRDAGDSSQDAAVRKSLCREPEALVDVAARKLTRHMMGSSMDSGSRKLLREGFDQARGSDPGRLTRDSMGMSMDTAWLAWNKDDRFESLMRTARRERTPEGTAARRSSREEQDYPADRASGAFLPRDQLEALVPDQQGPAVVATAARRTAREEVETSVGSLARRKPREQTAAAAAGEAREQPTLGQEFLGHPDAERCAGGAGQPDLTMTAPRRPERPSDPGAAGPLCRLVYDGILEKSRPSTAPGLGHLSASTPNVHQSALTGEAGGPPPVPPRAAHAAPTGPPRGAQERSGERDKGKRSSKLLSLFKKKKDCAPERLEGGLHRL